MPDRQIQTTVLIVGGGYAGLASSLFLSAQGVPSILADRHPAASVQGRARGINQRTMELYRPLGLEPALLEAARPFAADSGVARCQVLAGDWEWLFDPDPDPAAALASPSAFCLADQNTVEPLLRAAARERGADLRLDTEVRDVSIDAGGVTAVLAGNGPPAAVRADYLIAADGHASPLRRLAGIGRAGPGVTQHWVSIVIDAGLDQIITRRALFWIVLNERLGFASFVTTATPGRWAVSVTYDPRTTAAADFTAERCTQIAHAAIGRDDIAVTVVSVAAWEQAVGVADAYRSGRVFLVGDSAHVWPPAGAMGANSAVQDASNLAWKLGAVQAGLAGDTLLDTYQAERRPVALALADLTVRRQAARFGGGLDDDIDDLVLTLGQRYRSAAIAGEAPGAPFGRPVADRPEAGARMPHARLVRDGSVISSHDLFTGGFVLLAGPAGTSWLDAADQARGATGVRLDAYRVGRDLGDPDGAWERFALPGGAAVLARPDGYVAWTGGDAPALAGVLRRLLQAP
jgi:2-polyprenyl-6-methoxyphenol hydroxylase-like FAD-dependent oxidoreductase